MTGTNHTLTGAVIAVVVKQPALAVPLAFVSHFVLDALPHFGVDYHERHNYPSFKRVLGTDLVVMPLLLILVPFLLHSWWVLTAMLIAIAPDAIWFIKFYLDLRRGVKFQLPQDPFSRFHKRIQWGERPWGWRIEIAWAVFVMTLLVVLA
jgi:hypothetical protein